MTDEQLFFSDIKSDLHKKKQFEPILINDLNSKVVPCKYFIKYNKNKPLHKIKIHSSIYLSIFLREFRIYDLIIHGCSMKCAKV